jgi:diacylglycerol kinase (ATP)
MDGTPAIALLANPTAGRGRYKGLIPTLVERLGASGHPVRLLSAASPEDAEQACRQAVADGCAALVTAGGDGTIHLGLQAVAGTGVPFGAIPAGTGNDFIVDLKLPTTPLDAADNVADCLRTNKFRSIDLAKAQDVNGNIRWFGAVLAAGFDAIVNERANAMRFPKGPRRYDVAIFVELMKLKPRHYTLTLDGVRHEVDGVLIAVGNTASYGGGMRICPAADATDGLLDVVLAGPVSRTTLVRIKPRLRTGTHVTHKMVHTYTARRVELAVEGKPIVGYADGERSLSLPMSIECVPNALRLLG